MRKLYQPAYIYFVHAPMCGLIKIGRTDDFPTKRLGCLRAVSPVPLEPLALIWGERVYEGWLHKIFADIRSHGEWFRDDPRLRKFIARWAHPWEAAVAAAEVHHSMFAEVPGESLYARGIRLSGVREKWLGNHPLLLRAIKPSLTPAP